MNKEINLIIYIHGVQSDKFDPKSIKDFISEIDSRLVGDRRHLVYNWDEQVYPLEEDMYESHYGVGNWLTQKIRKALCFVGLDMVLDLITLVGNRENDHHQAVQRNLNKLIEEAIATYKEHYEKVSLTFVCHSFGNKIGLTQIIDHPERSYNFICMGSPLGLFSCAYPNWGDPDKLPQIKNWANIVDEDDPIAWYFKYNRGKNNFKWRIKVKDYRVKSFHIAPILSHTSYWKNSQVFEIVSKEINGFKG